MLLSEIPSALDNGLLTEVIACSADDIKEWALLEFWSIRKQKLWPKQVSAKFIKKWSAGIKIIIQALFYIFAKQSARAWTILKLYVVENWKQTSICQKNSWE